MNLNKQSKDSFNLQLNRTELGILTAILGSSVPYITHQEIKNSDVAKRKIISVPSLGDVVEFLSSEDYEYAVSLLKEDVAPEVIKTVEFVYDKGEYGVSPKWRTLKVTAENDKYIEGFEGDDFKKFCKSKVVGGRVMEVISQ